MVVAGAAAVLAVLMARRPPVRQQARLLAYACAFLTNQAVAAFYGISAPLPGITLEPRDLTPADVVYAVATAVLAVWTFQLVRVWVSDERRKPTGDDGRSALTRVMVGSAAAGAALVMMFTSNVVQRGLSSLLALPHTTFPLAPGGIDQWLITTIVLGVAGLVEEPVFVGIAVLLWPREHRGALLTAAVVSTLVRAAIHLYYARGVTAAIPAVVLVLVWCAMWSGFNLYLVHRTRLLWPVVVPHASGFHYIDAETGQLSAEGL